MMRKRAFLLFVCTSICFSWLMPVADAATITLKMPNGGKNLELGANSAVTWVYSGYPDSATVRVTLVRDGAEVGEIAKNVPIRYSMSPSGNGALPSMWKTGVLLTGAAPAACGYKVRVSVNGAPGTDESDQAFCLVAAGSGPVLKLTSPNGGEVLRVGDTARISWTFTGPDTPLRIKLIKAGGYDKGLIAATTTGKKSVDWKVGSILPPLDKQAISPDKDYTIRLETTAGSLKDESDGPFTIVLRPDLTPAVVVPGAARTTAALMGPKSIQITAPAAGTTLQRTGELNITYTFTPNLKDSHIKILLMKIGAPESSAYVLSEKKYINSGSFFCYVPGREVLEAGSYKIRVQSLNYADLYADSAAIRIVPKEEPVSKVYKAETKNHSKHFQKAKNGAAQVAWDIPGGSVPDPGNGKSRVGFVNRCHDGDQKNVLYRSFIRFNLSEIKGKVQRARLSYVKDDGTPEANKPLYVLNAPWNGSASDLFNVPATAVDPNKLEQIVQKWVDNPTANFGLLMAGPNEAMPCNNVGHIMVLGDVQLSIGILAIY